MYLLFVDESGTHGRSPVFIVGGIAIHEQDAHHLQTRLARVLENALGPGIDASKLELHGAEIRSPKAGRSPWFGIPLATRLHVLRCATGTLADYQPVDPSKGPTLFSAVVDRTYPDHEVRAYEELLHRFEGMLIRRGYEAGAPLHERGLVIHDRRVVERDIQTQTQKWRRASGRIDRRLQYLADVPLFADSQASNLIQAADLVCYSLWRYYGLRLPDDQYIQNLWDCFDRTDDGVIHGLAHIWRGFARGDDCCPACESRRRALA